MQCYIQKLNLDQFAEGLDSCGVLKVIRDFRCLTKPFFTIEGRPQLTSGIVYDTHI